jgi:cytoskeletal protein RodZ
VVATIILGVLLMLSLILVVTTIFPHVNVTRLLIVLSIALALGCLIFAAMSWRSRSTKTATGPEDDQAAARKEHAHAIKTAKSERDNGLATARTAHKRELAKAKTTYEQALGTAGADQVARATAKADYHQAQADAHANQSQRAADVRSAYTRAEATAAAERDKALAAAKAAARSWTMPPLALLAKPEWSKGRIIAMYTMRGYLLVAVILLAVKAGKLASGH